MYSLLSRIRKETYMPTNIVTFRTSQENKTRIDVLAERTGKSSSFIYNMLIDEYLGKLEESFDLIIAREAVKAGRERTYSLESIAKAFGYEGGSSVRIEVSESVKKMLDGLDDQIRSKVVARMFEIESLVPKVPSTGVSEGLSLKVSVDEKIEGHRFVCDIDGDVATFLVAK